MLQSAPTVMLTQGALLAYCGFSWKVISESAG